MRQSSAHSIKSYRSGRKPQISAEPKDGTKTRHLYDIFKANKGRIVRIELLYRIEYLRTIYGLDIRTCGKHNSRHYCLVGEWFGRVYIDYIANPQL